MQIDIRINCKGWPGEDKLQKLVEKAVFSTVEFAGLKYDEDAELSLLFTSDEEVKELNRNWRNKDKPTNVLSFPAADLIEPGEVRGPLLGDIIVALQTCIAEAALAKKPLNDHLVHLIIHGLLHLFGFDHETPQEAGIMEALEIGILAQMNIANPYEEAIN